MQKPPVRKTGLELERFVPYRLSLATNMVSEVIAGAYRALFGLTIAQWRVIAVLAERGRGSQYELSAITLMDKVTVSRAAIALVDRGLLSRAVNPEDQRAHLLALSKAGRDLYQQVVPKALALEKTLLAGFTRDETERLIDMLRRLEAAAQELPQPADGTYP